MSSTAAYRAPARSASTPFRNSSGPGLAAPSSSTADQPDAPKRKVGALARFGAAIQAAWARPQAGRRILGGISMYGTVASPGSALAHAFANETALGEAGSKAVGALRRGGTAGDAAERSGLFDPTVVAILRAGERTRRFGPAVESARAHLDARWKNFRFVATAFAVLWLELLAALASVAWLAVQGFPQIRGTMAAAPAATKLLQALERAELANTALLVVAGAVVASASIATLAVVAGKRFGWLRRAVSLVPGLTPLLESSGLASSCEVAASILKADLGFERACEAAAGSTVVARVSAHWTRAIERARAGDDPTAAIARSPLNPGERSLILACRNFRQLGATLEAIGGERAQRARTQMQLLASASGALLIGFIVLSGVNLLQAYSVQMQGRDVVLETLSEQW